jgi:hypothetical protein
MIAALMSSRLPDFLIIGAPKAGTTWLVQSLRRHPRVFLPKQELYYWTTPSRMDADHSWYREQFAGAAPDQVIGDRSNSYLVEPEAAETIVRNLPDVKIIAALRNPIDRAYSGYCMRLRNGTVTRDVARYLDPATSVCPEILRNSLYCEKLAPYLARFARSRMHFVVFDDIEARPRDVVDALCRFLGIESLPDLMVVPEKVNAKEAKRLPPALMRLLPSRGIAKRVRSAVRSTRLGRMLGDALKRKTEYPPLPPELRARMAEYFRADVESLSALLGRDLRHWVAEAAAPASGGARDDRARDAAPVGGT